MEPVKTSYSVLLNGQPNFIPGTFPVSGQALIFPRLQAARSAREIVYSILVERVTGAPTTASLYLGIQGGFRTTKGDTTPPAGVGGGVGSNRYNFADVAQQWFTLDAEQDGAYLPDGNFPIVAADQTLSSGTLSTAVALGDKTITSATQYSPGATLNIDSEAFYVIGAPTTADAGATWVHPVISAGGPHGTGDATDATNLGKGWASKTHSSGATIHAPRRYFKRVLGGFDQRLIAVPTFTGGTDPAFVLSVDVRARG
jgi:hypothetical protein